MAAAAPEVALVKSGNPITKFSREPPPLRDHLRVSAASRPSSAGPKKKSAKTEIKETLLTRRFYTTDFDEMEQLFNTEINGNPNQAEFEALIDEFKTDYNQTHFVRNPEFTEAADRMRGPLRMVFVAFLERSCTAEFSGFLLYKELGRRLKETNPVVAEIFSLVSRDEARHAGFLNKGLSDFNLALDLDSVTKTRKHLKANPEFEVYPIFKYFENWCQDENRHGDFFSASLKTQPQFLNDWKTKLWSRFFCLSTNRTTARIFPAVLDVENPEFKRKLDRMVDINQKLIANGESQDLPLVKNSKRIPLIAALVSDLVAASHMPPVESRSVDFADFES
ncbi:Magnesium-protoporphyrin IX monomethyl ester oxidative cyclase [Musa troglodytarum]|uniref:magnesium-protoporphyrin IX monomethyl ester (oxidative) cyclase n=1 Tax=Musa troglodytarum TaxID=320322 RepID=A0A9E7HF55_9LILI|nr:Magnesium-protoporphyrin IX monomethyl ester oxidative cyclase [Musa troglodytarum]